MREHIYNAIRLDNQEWTEGSLVLTRDSKTNPNRAYICSNPIASETFGHHLYIGNFIEVDPETVCEFTGLLDSEKNKIFEGDYLGCYCTLDNDEEGFGIIGTATYWEDGGKWALTDDAGCVNDWTLEPEADPEQWLHLTRCGNMHDRPSIDERVKDGLLS